MRQTGGWPRIGDESWRNQAHHLKEHVCLHAVIHVVAAANLSSFLKELLYMRCRTVSRSGYAKNVIHALMTTKRSELFQSKMNGVQKVLADWKLLVDVLRHSASAGRITTYADASIWAYGIPKRNQPNCWCSKQRISQLTNRVIRSNSYLADLPDGPDQSCI